MSERFAIAGQAAGIISFKEPITENSASSPAAQKLDIPEGMLSIGGNGRGYVITEQTYTFSPALTEGTYVLYANDPVDATGTGSGIAEIDHQGYAAYIAGAGHPSPTKIYHGDTNSRRAFCYFQVDVSLNIITTSIRTISSFAFEEQYDYLQKIGFYVFGKEDPNFTFRGNYWDERVKFADATLSWDTTAVTDWLLVHRKDHPGWVAATAYSIGDYIYENGYEYKVSSVSGTVPYTSHAVTEPTWSSYTTKGATVVDNELTWTNTGTPYGYYDKSIADDSGNPERETVIGIAEIDRDGISDENYVVSSGFMNMGTTYLPNAEFPVGTFLYLTDKLDHLQTGRPSVQTSGSAAVAALSVGNIVRDIDFWENGTAYTVNDIIVDDSTTTYIWRCITNGTSGATCPDFAGAVKTIGDVGVVGTTIVDNTTEWACEAVYNQQTFKGNRKVRIGVSLGHGQMLFQPGFAGITIDDHDESAYAHADIQTAMNKAGIYVMNTAQGKRPIDVTFQGQHFDELAVFSSGSNYDVVYKTNTDHQYGPAQAGQAGNIDNAIGIRLPGSKVACGTGFVDYDTTAGGPSGLLTSGQKLYLSSTSAGTLTTTKTDITPFVGYCIQGNADLTQDTDAGEARGCIFLLLSVTDEDVASSMLLDETATLSGAVTGDIVYKTAVTHQYGPAQGGGVGNIDNAIGIALSTTTIALGTGLVQYDTSSFTAGDKLYLSNSVAGAVTNIKGSDTPFLGYCIHSGIVSAGGLMYLMISGNDEDITGGSSVNEGDFFVNDDVFAGIQGILKEDKAVTDIGTASIDNVDAHGLSPDDYIYVTATSVTAGLDRGIYKVKTIPSTTVFTLKDTADADLTLTLSGTDYISWVGPQSTDGTDALVDGNGFFIPGASMHSMIYDDALDAWTVSNNLIVASTGTFVPPVGTTAQAPAAASYTGGLRWNSDTLTLDTSNGTVWSAQATQEFSTAIAIALG